MYYEPEIVLERIRQLPEFETKLEGKFPQEFWIQSYRSADDNPDEFDDTFALWFGEERLFVTTGTTNPGTPVLQGGFKRYNRDGAAVVQADRIYKHVWRRGLHQGKYPALKQIRNMTIFRDGDGDNKAEEIGPVKDQLAGINFHPDQHNTKKDVRADDREIGWWSAGCQVLNIFEDYLKFLAYIGDQEVTYIILNEHPV